MARLPSIIIAAPQSGSGKTTITIGLMECQRRKGRIVAPFKIGPDFIDPGYHRQVTGRPSINLDGWMCGADFVMETFSHHCQGADVAVIEGVMGLFDGIGEKGDEGSTAQIARLTESPVVLVVDARSMAGSAAALVKGFAEFDPQVQVAGVIFNNVGSDNHAGLLKKAMAALPEVAVLGCIGREEKLHIPGRHLGLLTAEENPLSPDFLRHLAETLEGCLDLDALWALAKVHVANDPQEAVAVLPSLAEGARGAVKIAIARDEAFCFMYEDNLRLLRQAGAEIVEFSPLRNAALPAGIGGVYLPGGYPEVFADTLAANIALKEALRTAIEQGMPVYAECGGFIYLTEGVLDVHADAGSLHELVGIFPVRTRMLSRRKALGYREIVSQEASILGSAALVARGHEFHYSEIIAPHEPLPALYRVRKEGIDLGAEGYRYRNCLASYIHLHFGSNARLATSFVEFCRRYKSKRQ